MRICEWTKNEQEGEKKSFQKNLNICGVECSISTLHKLQDKPACDCKAGISERRRGKCTVVGHHDIMMSVAFSIFANKQKSKNGGEENE